ncbi:hypothetical protein [Thiomonas delicata]|nr:hypothetical protein [Thiomonas delicata]
MDAAMQAAMKAADIYMAIGSIFIALGTGLGIWMLVQHRRQKHGS